MNGPNQRAIVDFRQSMASSFVLVHDFYRQVCWPFRLVHSIGSHTDIVSQVDLSFGKLDDRLYRPHAFIISQNISDFKEIRLKEYSTSILRQHTHVPGDCIAHAMIVAKDLLSIPRPNIFPDVLRVRADTVDQPLRVVVQCNLPAVRVTSIVGGLYVKNLRQSCTSLLLLLAASRRSELNKLPQHQYSNLNWGILG